MTTKLQTLTRLLGLMVVAALAATGTSQAEPAVSTQPVAAPGPSTTETPPAATSPSATPPAATPPASTSPPPATTVAAPSPPTVTAPAVIGATPPPPVRPTAAETQTPAAASPPSVTATVSEPQPIDAAKAVIADPAVVRSAHPDDLAAVADAYGARTSLIWVVEGKFSAPAHSIIAELKKADDYGLDAKVFEIADVLAGATVADQGAADVRLSLAALRYARHAKGGRIEPVSLSSMLDVAPPLRDPKVVLKDLVDTSTPDAVLRAQHPKHPEFELLRQALLAARAPAKAEAVAIDPALLIKIPDGKTLKKGAVSDDVALLRQRLKIPVSADGDVKTFDADVDVALKAYQTAQGLKPNGQLNKRTRTSLNREGEPKVIDPKREIDRLIVNMERWRWLPDNLGPMYVMNNVPEFMTRVIKGDQTLFEERIIVGLPTWPTPMLTDSIERIVFNPEWGVPDGIKVKELLPRLKRASAQSNGFFDQFFGGGSSGGGRVLAAYGLKPSINGRPVDANSVDWNRVDIRRYSFVQPAGGQNPLGNVKFMFPNSHDVYMHDTSSRNLFQQSQRALSHGCIRVENPRELAKILLAEDKGWSGEQVDGQYGGGTNDVALTIPVPVYLTYFTARPGKDGKITTYGDIYGTDGRIMSALTGKPVRFETPRASDEIADASFDEEPGSQSKKNQSNKQAATKRKQGDNPGDLIQNAFSGLLFN